MFLVHVYAMQVYTNTIPDLDQNPFTISVEISFFKDFILIINQSNRQRNNVELYKPIFKFRKRLDEFQSYFLNSTLWCSYFEQLFTLRKIQKVHDFPLALFLLFCMLIKRT